MAPKKGTKDKDNVLRKRHVVMMLVEKFAKQGTTITKSVAGRFIDYFGEIAMDSLLNGQGISIQGFFKLETRERSARTIFNPQRKTFKKQPPSTVAAISLSPSFKERFKENTN
jgi:nucleoid DNA-binding protein